MMTQKGCVYVSVVAGVCVCVGEREREKKGTEKARKGARAQAFERKSPRLCVCVTRAT